MTHSESDVGVLRKQVADVVKHCFPDSTGVGRGQDAVLRLSGSASKAIYRVDVAVREGTRRVCLRSTRTPGEGQNLGLSLRNEAEVMRRARAAGVPVPSVLAILPNSPLGDGIFMDWVEGESDGRRITTAPSLARVRESGLLGRQCGEALARVHATPLQHLRDILPTSSLDPLLRVAQLQAEVKSSGLCRPVLDFTLEWLKRKTPKAETSLVLVHGDYRNGNFVVGHQGLAGVLDWELASCGNRYEDLGWLCVKSWRFGAVDREVGGFASLEDLCDGYEPAGGPVDREAVVWWTLLGTVKWALLCVKMGIAFTADPRIIDFGVVGRRLSEAEFDCVCTIAEQTGASVNVLREVVTSTALAPCLNPMFPSSAALVGAAQQAVSRELAPALANVGEKRRGFVGHVVGNLLGIVARGLRDGDRFLDEEVSSLRLLLGYSGGGVVSLRAELVERLRNGRMAVDAPGLLQHLLGQVARQLTIDQPKYPSFVAALSRL